MAGWLGFPKSDGIATGATKVVGTMAILSLLLSCLVADAGWRVK